MKQPLGQALDWPAEEEEKCDQDGGDSEQNPVAQPADDTEHSAHPNRRRRGKAGDVTDRIAHDHPGAEKADSGKDALDHAADSVLVGT